LMNDHFIQASYFGHLLSKTSSSFNFGSILVSGPIRP
jgi:hypothetical protein